MHSLAAIIVPLIVVCLVLYVCYWIIKGINALTHRPPKGRMVLP